MSSNWTRWFSTLALAGTVVACGDDGEKKQSVDRAMDTDGAAGQPSVVNPTGGDGSLSVPDGRVGTTPTSPAPGQDGSVTQMPDSAVDGGSPSLTPPARNDAGSADAGTPDDEVVIEDAGRGPLAPPDPQFGLTCHNVPAGGKLITSMTAAAPWAAPVGGTLRTGLYELTAEERLPLPEATPEKAAECTAFYGVRQELLEITATEWRRTSQGTDGVRTKQTFAYTVTPGGIVRTQTCPVSAVQTPEMVTNPYSVNGDELLVFDSWRDTAAPGMPVVCRELYRYQRRP